MKGFAGGVWAGGVGARGGGGGGVGARRGVEDRRPLVVGLHRGQLLIHSTAGPPQQTGPHMGQRGGSAAAQCGPVAPAIDGSLSLSLSLTPPSPSLLTPRLSLSLSLSLSL